MRQAPGLPRVDVRINGVEIESVDGTSFGGTPHVLVGSDRGSNVDVYLVTDPAQPQWVQLLPSQVTMLTEANGQPLKVDPEGIAKVNDGCWVASEGNAVAHNELIKLNTADVTTTTCKNKPRAWWCSTATCGWPTTTMARAGLGCSTPASPEKAHFLLSKHNEFGFSLWCHRDFFPLGCNAST